jgi:hypothetical protein
MYFRAILLVLAGVMLVGAMCHRYDEFAGGTGSLNGVISDSTTRQSVIGATITIKGTTLDTLTDLDGRYKISRIPPGTWAVSISSVGYKTLEIDNVVITANQSTRLDASLVENEHRDMHRMLRLKLL